MKRCALCFVLTLNFVAESVPACADGTQSFNVLSQSLQAAVVMKRRPSFGVYPEYNEHESACVVGGNEKMRDKGRLKLTQR